MDAKQKKYNKWLLITLISFITPQATANKNLSLTSDKAYLFSALKPTITLSTGLIFSKLGQITSFTPLDLCHYTYQPQGHSVNPLYGGFVGSEFKQTPSWRFVAGLGYYQPASLSTKGILTQGADSVSSDTYSYRYRTTTQQLLAEGKLYWIDQHKIQPFLMVGLGAAFNKTSNYQTNVPLFFAFTPKFSNHSQTNFTYAIGPGIELNLTKSVRIGIGYRFTDLGPSPTGTAQIDNISIPNALKHSHLYANQILAQFTFIPWMS
jgi:opacity protein-like surface antigen